MIDHTVSGHYVGDCRELLAQLPAGCVQTCITSPPYWGLRDYGVDGQLGLESTPDAFVAALVEVFDGVRRVLRDDGTLWVNLGDSYAGSPGGFQGKNGQRASRTFTAKTDFVKRADGIKTKDLVGIPWMVAFALRAAGWYLRADIIWHKPNPMPESVRDRPTKAHEYLFLFAKSESYFYDADAIAERSTWKGQNRSSRDPAATAMPGAPPHAGLRNDTPTGRRNKRSVWTVAPRPYKGAHFATYPPALIEPCVLACSRPGDIVLDPFFGSGTTGEVAARHGRRYIGFDLSASYADLARIRLRQSSMTFAAIPAAR